MQNTSFSEGKKIPANVAAGLRRTTPESLAALKYARSYRQEGARRVSRTAALKIAKQAAAAMGLKAAKLALIDQLFACSKPADWTHASAAPVVWPSNDRLARAMGVSVSTMKHHLNGLVKAGLVAYSDGPTYQRRGRRDAHGNIVEGHGIDLSPIAVRYDELTELVEAAAYAARQRKRHSWRRTVLVKELRSLIASATGKSPDGTHGETWSHALARLDAIRECRPGDLEELAGQVRRLEALQDELEEAYDALIRDMNFNSALSKFRPIQTTAQHSESGICNQNGIAQERDTSIPETACGSKAFEKKPGARAPEHKQSPVAAARATKERQSPVEDDETIRLSIGLMRQACPAVAAARPRALDDWHALRDCGRALCAGAGINPQVWHEACDVLGPDIAIAATAVTVQKADMGLVASPGAYLRTLTKRGRTGDLRIVPSLHGLAARNGDGAGGPQRSGAKGAKTSEPGHDAASTAAADPFPAGGSIAFSRWGEMVRSCTPDPTPDVDIVANAFRRWAIDGGIDLTSPNIARIFTGFCRKWRSER